MAGVPAAVMPRVVHRAVRRGRVETFGQPGIGGARGGLEPTCAADENPALSWQAPDRRIRHAMQKPRG
jgi:hypothetical protein